MLEPSLRQDVHSEGELQLEQGETQSVQMKELLYLVEGHSVKQRLLSKYGVDPVLSHVRQLVSSLLSQVAHTESH